MLRHRLAVLLNTATVGLALVAGLIALKPNLAFASEEETATCTASMTYCCKCWYTSGGGGTFVKHCQKDSTGTYNTCAGLENPGYCPEAGQQQCDN
jgi:hypothetical protein